MATILTSGSSGGSRSLSAAAGGLRELKQSEALLVIFNLAIRPDHDDKEEDLAQRVMLETVAYDAQEMDCRILNSFHSKRWRRRLYESLAHLHQSGYISCAMHGYDLTNEGRARARGFELTVAEQKRVQELIDSV